jgi:hypothetical protein
MASTRVLGGAAAGLVALAALVAVPAWRHPADAPPAAGPGRAPARDGAGGEAANAASPSGAPPAAAARAGTAPNPDTPPDGLSAEQWRELRAALADHPQREAETARVVAYLQFAARWQHFVERRSAGAPAAELRPTALELDRALDARVQRRELGGAEARAVKGALLDVLEPDPAARERTLRTWQSGVEAALRSTHAAQRTADEAQAREFERRQAEIVAAWRALPPARRDAQRLEAELEALRQSVFAAPNRNEGDKR